MSESCRWRGGARQGDPHLCEVGQPSLFLDLLGWQVSHRRHRQCGGDAGCPKNPRRHQESRGRGGACRASDVRGYRCEGGVMSCGAPTAVEGACRPRVILGPFSQPLGDGVVDDARVRDGVEPEVVGGVVECVDQEGNRRQLFLRLNVAVAKQEGMRDGEFGGAQIQISRKHLFGDAASAIVLNGIFGALSATQYALVVCGVPGLPTSTRGPSVPDCSESCSTNCCCW